MGIKQDIWQICIPTIYKSFTLIWLFIPPSFKNIIFIKIITYGWNRVLQNANFKSPGTILTTLQFLRLRVNPII